MVTVKLSPVQHRIPNRDERVILGHDALPHLNVKVNFKQKRLEFDEVVVHYDD